MSLNLDEVPMHWNNNGNISYCKSQEPGKKNIFNEYVNMHRVWDQGVDNLLCKATDHVNIMNPMYYITLK